jgi:hypothetical protein
MSRLPYRCLVRLHPRAFRERFGDEMLCVFDETAPAGAAALFVDACVSLARQWLLRSGLWRWAVGAGVTALLIVGYAHSEANWQRQQAIARALAKAKAARPFDKAEFNREAAAAVAMLARYREGDKKRSRRVHPQSVTPEEASQD